MKDNNKLINYPIGCSLTHYLDENPMDAWSVSLRLECIQGDNGCLARIDRPHYVKDEIEAAINIINSQLIVLKYKEKALNRMYKRKGFEKYEDKEVILYINSRIKKELKEYSNEYKYLFWLRDSYYLLLDELIEPPPPKMIRIKP